MKRYTKLVTEKFVAGSIFRSPIKATASSPTRTEHTFCKEDMKNYLDKIDHYSTKAGPRQVKSRIWFHDGMYHSYSIFGIGFIELSFFQRLVVAFWYLFRPRDDDALSMVRVTVTEGAPPIDIYQNNAQVPQLR